jgi:hypothetical protein
MNWLLEWIQNNVSKTASLVVGCIILGSTIAILIPKLMVTAEQFEGEKAKIVVQMKQGDRWNKLDIVQWKLQDAVDKRTNLKLFITLKQGGVATVDQRDTLDVLNSKIKELEAEQKRLLEKLKTRE